MSHLPERKIPSPDIARYAANAGFQGLNLQIAVAVALAESGGGNANAHNDRGEDSRGLWQINVAANTDLAGANLYDPATNAQAAMTIYKRQGWRAWSMFKNGGYLLRMPAAGAAILSMPARVQASPNPLMDPVGAAGQSGLGQAIGGLSDTLKGAEKVRKWITTPANVGRVAMGVVAAVVILIGIATLLEPVVTKTIREVRPV